MSQIKIVPASDPNADGEWIEVPVDTKLYRRWRDMDAAVTPHIPAGYHVVQVGNRPAETPLRSVAEILGPKKAEKVKV